MDTSEKYIKVCESAKDIQRCWNLENGDYIFDPADGEASVASTAKCRIKSIATIRIIKPLRIYTTLEYGLDIRQKNFMSLFGSLDRTNFRKYA
jgi:hypothetical protein